MTSKEFILEFLHSDYYKDIQVYNKYIHPNIELSWNSSEGFSKFNFDEFKDIVMNMGKSFSNLTAEISHAIFEDNEVAIRFTYHVETLEHQDSLPLAHFMSIWEIKDEKIVKIYLMSHAADDNVENLISYLNI
jgi:hypothetical protein